MAAVSSGPAAGGHLAKNLIGKHLPGGHRQQDLAQCHPAAYCPQRELWNLR